LASAISTRLGAPLLPRLLHQLRWTHTQTMVLATILAISLLRLL
jgi:hypothetical protein